MSKHNFKEVSIVHGHTDILSKNNIRRLEIVKREYYTDADEVEIEHGIDYSLGEVLEFVLFDNDGNELPQDADEGMRYPIGCAGLCESRESYILACLEHGCENSAYKQFELDWIKQRLKICSVCGTVENVKELVGGFSFSPGLLICQTCYDLAMDLRCRFDELPERRVA